MTAEAAGAAEKSAKQPRRKALVEQMRVVPAALQARPDPLSTKGIARESMGAKAPKVAELLSTLADADQARPRSTAATLPDDRHLGARLALYVNIFIYLRHWTRVQSPTMATRKGIGDMGHDGSLLNTAKMRARRQELELTQEQAAVKAGFQGRQAWNNIESGRQATVTLATLARIAGCLDMSAKYLLKDDRPRRRASAEGKSAAKQGGPRRTGK